jgi:DNA-binding HxlR family transcriptional regulator
MIKISKKKKLRKVINFFKKKGLFLLLEAAKEQPLKVNELKRVKPYRPELIDLYNLYQFIIKNKRITSLEFGCGWSSLVIALALRENKKKYSAFQNYVVDNEKKYLKISKNRIKEFDQTLLKENFFLFSKVKIVKNDFRYVTEFKELPNINYV